VKNSLLYYFGLITQIGLTVIICILLSLLIGRWLDARFGFKGTFTVLFIFIGIPAGFVSAYKQIMGKDGK